jgi:hypothetical protein
MICIVCHRKRCPSSCDRSRGCPLKTQLTASYSHRFKWDSELDTKFNPDELLVEMKRETLRMPIHW